MGIGPGTGRGGRRPGAGRKKKAEQPVFAATFKPETEIPRTPRAEKLDRSVRIGSFRSWCREWTLQNIEGIAREVMEIGSMPQRVEFLMWMSRHGFGDAPKSLEVIHSSDGGPNGPEEILNAIAKRRSLEEAAKLEKDRDAKEAQKLLPPPLDASENGKFAA